MKLSGWILALSFSSFALAKTTLVIPLFIDGPEPMAKVNAKLKKKGLKTLPEFWEVSTSDNAYEKGKKLDTQIADALKALGKEYEGAGRIFGGTPGSQDTKTLKTCYKGDPRGVADLATGLADIVYSDQLNLWGWKYKKETVVSEYQLQNEENEGDTEKYLSKNSKLWKNWRGEGEAVLILTAYSDDGDDINEGIIFRCRD